MFDKNLNINPTNNHFPEPDIGVDDAWSSMQKMLDEPAKRTTILPDGTVKKYWISAIVLLIIAGFVMCFLSDKIVRNNSTKKISSINLNEKKSKAYDSINTIQSATTNTNSSLLKNDTLKNLLIEESNKIVAFTNDTLNSDKNKLSSSKENNTSKSLVVNKIRYVSKVFSHVGEMEKLNLSNHTIKENSSKSLPEKYLKYTLTKNGRFIRFNKQGKINNSEKINNSKNEINIGFNKSIAVRKSDDTIKNNTKKSKVNYKVDNIINIKKSYPIIGKAEKYFRHLTSSIKIKITPSISTTIIADSTIIDTTNKNTKLNVKLKKADSKGLKRVSEILSKNKIDIGLQWNFPIPNGGNYFTGINAQNQPYLLLLPSFWATKMINKNEIMFSFTPLQQNFTKNKIMDTVKPAPVPVPVPVPGPGPVFSSPYLKTQRLLKTFGFSAGLFYNYYVTPSISIGLGLKYNRQNLALERDVIFSRITRTHVLDTIFIVKKSSLDWKYLKPYFISGHLELAYTKKKFSSGLNISAPITNLSIIDKENLRPINCQLFIRWKIL